MSLKEHTMYSVVCDFASCTADAQENHEFVAWADSSHAVDLAIDWDWLEYEGNHFCPEHQHHCEKVDEPRPGAPVDCDCQP